MTGGNPRQKTNWLITTILLARRSFIPPLTAEEDQMRIWIRRGVVVLGFAAGVGLMFVPIFPVDSTVSTVGHLDLEASNGGGSGFPTSQTGPPIPPDGSSWHWLWPASQHCLVEPQNGYEDGDNSGDMSPCDRIVIGDISYHIQWVGPTYFMTCFPPDGSPPVPDFTAEPNTQDPANESPVGEIWHWIWPPEIYCEEFVVDSWEDANGDGRFNECDQINVFEQGPGLPPTYYHIDRIGLDIIVGDPVDQANESTWGMIKDLFR
jgi:hypothetical protein